MREIGGLNMARWAPLCLFVALCIVARASAEECVDAVHGSKGYDPYDVGNLAQSSAQYGIARAQTVNLYEHCLHLRICHLEDFQKNFIVLVVCSCLC
jgi:hypothetical protein